VGTGFAQIAAFSPQICPNRGVFPPDFPRKRKRSRWNQDSLEQKTVIPGMPTVIPPGLTREQERAYIGNGFGGKRSGFGDHRPRGWAQNTSFGLRFLHPPARG
uniref:Uncharacterized protein n=1 Tax=Cyanistes caeruleus TaxID=156563 RepID=A0A8C0UBT6_CYACU